MANAVARAHAPCLTMSRKYHRALYWARRAPLARVFSRRRRELAPPRPGKFQSRTYPPEFGPGVRSIFVHHRARDSGSCGPPGFVFRFRSRVVRRLRKPRSNRFPDAGSQRHAERGCERATGRKWRHSNGRWRRCPTGWKRRQRAHWRRHAVGWFGGHPTSRRGGSLWQRRTRRQRIGHRGQQHGTDPVRRIGVRGGPTVLPPRPVHGSRPRALHVLGLCR